MRNFKTRCFSLLLSVLIVLGIIGGFGSAVNADDLYFIKQPFSGSCDYSEPYIVTWAISGIWYYFENNGSMLANTSKTIDGKTYYFDATGRCTNP